MSVLVLVTDEFGQWFAAQGERVQDDVSRVVEMLQELGTRLPFPYSSAISGSRHGHMRELRVQSGGEPYRIFYAFDPRRAAILIIAGNKGGDDRFYRTMIPRADDLYDVYLTEIEREGPKK